MTNSNPDCIDDIDGLLEDTGWKEELIESVGLVAAFGQSLSALATQAVDVLIAAGLHAAPPSFQNKDEFLLFILDAIETFDTSGSTPAVDALASAPDAAVAVLLCVWKMLYRSAFSNAHDYGRPPS